MQLSGNDQRQLQYLAAVGEYKLGHLLDARQRLKMLLTQQPEFSQAKMLLEAVDDKLADDALIIGGAIAAVGGVAALVLGALFAGGRR
jgi:hypothetical protein